MQFFENDILIRNQTLRLAYATDFPATENPCYWASLWPAALALAEHIFDENENKWQGRRVLEMGCGCGLAGIAAGLQGAEVTVTDLEPAALDLAADNWKKNGLQPAALEQMDWCAPAIDARYDLILGADILYHPPDFPDLIRSVHTLLDDPGTLLISEPGRPQTHEFYARMIQKGYRIDSTHHPVSLHGNRFEICVSEIT